jgi:hypothetical protein
VDKESHTCLVFPVNSGWSTRLPVCSEVCALDRRYRARLMNALCRKFQSFKELWLFTHTINNKLQHDVLYLLAVAMDHYPKCVLLIAKNINSKKTKIRNFKTPIPVLNSKTSPATCTYIFTYPCRSCNLVNIRYFLLIPGDVI